MRKRLIFFVAGIILCFSACALREEVSSTTSIDALVPSATRSEPENQESSSARGENTSLPQDELAEEDFLPDISDADLAPYKNRYIVGLADTILETILSEDSDDLEKITAIYEYLICNCYFAEPIGLDAWQFRGNPEEIPTYIEWYALSPLAFGQGSCEDFAAAMVLLCTRAGIPAQYLPGMTYSVDGELVDHAWAVVQLEEYWYHVDPQLEWNITHNQILQYQFFLKNDEEFYPGHIWGENLLEYYQNIGAAKSGEELKRIQEWIPPPCNGFLEAREVARVKILPRPNAQKILEELNRDRSAYEEKYGLLPEVEIEHAPPRG